MHRIGSWRPASVFRAACALALAADLVLPARAQGGAQAPDYEVDAAWPKPLPNNWLIGQIGGLAVATFITLLLVPVFYAIFVLDLKWITWDVTTKER